MFPYTEFYRKSLTLFDFDLRLEKFNMQMYVTPWSRILGKLLVAQIIRNFQTFIENEGSVFTVDTYPDADETYSHPSTLFL